MKKSVNAVQLKLKSKSAKLSHTQIQHAARVSADFRLFKSILKIIMNAISDLFYIHTSKKVHAQFAVVVIGSILV